MSKGMKHIKKLRKMIPSFQCNKECHDCCGAVPISPPEWNKLKDQRSIENIHCPYIGEPGCDIYHDRPIMCRLFGTVENLRCPHGYRPKKLLTVQEGKEIRKEYIKLF